MSAFVVSNDRSDGTPNVPDANATGKWRSALWRRNRESGQGTSTSIYLWDEALTTPDSVYLKWVPIGNFITTTDLLSLQAGSTKMSITSSSGNVYFDVVESALAISNISGNLPLSKLPSTVALVDAANTFSLHNTFSAGLTGALTGNATTATTLANSRSIYLTGDATGSVSGVDWATDVTINTTVTHSAVGSSSPYWNASHLMSRVIGNQTPADGEVYAWDQSANEWAPAGVATTTLGTLSDVSASNPTNGQLLWYVAGSSRWENFSPTTDDITEGTNLYYTQARFDTAFGAKSTTDLTEGTNLYYTQARFDTAFAAKSTTDLTEGTNLYYTDERVDDRLSVLIQEGTGIDHVYDDAANTYTLSVDFGDFTTTDLAEGTNLYYTDTRARLAVSASSPITYNNSTGGIGWNGTTTDVPEGTNLYYTDARWDTRLSSKDTDDLTEGSSNLYFTDARARAALSATGDLAYNSTTGALSHTDAVQSVNTATGTVVLDTDDIAEGAANLYYTEARVAANTAVTANTAKVTNVSTNLSVSRDGTKIDVVSSDGTNAVLPLADTNNWGVMSDEMFDKLDGIEAGATNEAAATTTVAGIVELATNTETTTGTDTTRAVTPAGVQAAVDEILDGAPAALDTLNELAAAINDDASYASTITTALGLKAPIASPTFTGTVAIPNISDLEAAVTANTAKVTNVTTNLSVSRDGTKLDVVSSDGTNAVLPLADTNNWGVMSDEMFDEHTVNNAKVGITSSQASAIVANTAKVTNVTTDLSVTANGTSLSVHSSDGTDASIPAVTTSAWGAMTDEDKTKLDGVATGATANDTDANLKARANHTGTQTAATISDFDTEVANNSAVTANTAKVTNVTTDLSVSRDGTKLDVVSSDGTNAVLPLADTNNWGVMSDEMFDEHTVNNAKVGITSSQASAIVANTAKVGITSSQASAIVANTAKVTNVTTDLSVSRDGTKLDVVSSDGTNAVLPLADTNNWGVMSDEMFDEHTANNAKVTNATHTGDVTGATSLTIANNAVSLAKMAGLARGSVIVGDSNGDPAALAIGTNTYVLTSDGTDISWAAGGGGTGGGHVILDEGTALTQRADLNLLGNDLRGEDDSTNTATKVISTEGQKRSVATGETITAENGKQVQIVGGLENTGGTVDIQSGGELVLIAPTNPARGKVLQTVNTTFSDITFSTTSQTAVEVTNFNATITPTSVDSKILILAMVSVGVQGNGHGGLSLMRGSTFIGNSSSASGTERDSMTGAGYSGTDNELSNVFMSYEDSPAATSATTYKVALSVSSGGYAAHINRPQALPASSITSYGISNITLLEIAA